MKKILTWTHPGREFLELKLEIDGDEIKSCRIKSIGCLHFLNFCQQMKKQIKGSVAKLKIPTENDHASMIWREVLLSLKEEWTLPVQQDELCHCRKITTEKVDRAIVYGAHTIEEIRQRTSANTGCGTCKEDVGSMISYRLKSS